MGNIVVVGRWDEDGVHCRTVSRKDTFIHRPCDQRQYNKSSVYVFEDVSQFKLRAVRAGIQYVLHRLLLGTENFQIGPISIILWKHFPSQVFIPNTPDRWQTSSALGKGMFATHSVCHNAVPEEPTIDSERTLGTLHRTLGVGPCGNLRLYT